MAKMYAASVLDGLLNTIKNSATRMILVKAYVAGDSYATATASGNVVASVTMASADYTLGGSNNRTLTTATKSATALVAAATTADDGHIIFTDGSSTILAVTDETGELAVAAGDTVNFPAITFTSNQPT